LLFTPGRDKLFDGEEDIDSFEEVKLLDMDERQPAEVN